MMPGVAISQAVTCMSPIDEVRVQFQSAPRDVFGEKSDNGTCPSPSKSVFKCQFNCIILYTDIYGNSFLLGGKPG